jgi:hypothetical protein
VRLPLAPLAAALFLAGCAASPPSLPDARPPDVRLRAALDDLAATCAAGHCGVAVPRGTRVDTLLVDADARRVTVRFTRALGEVPWRPDGAARFEARVADSVAAAFPGFAADVRAAQHPLGALVPNAFRAPADVDTARQARPWPDRPAPLVEPLSRAHAPTRGLAGRHLALWPSHGWYYEPALDRWEWQRARVFTTVEDLLPFAFLHTDLVPMLERAGATVLLPRERDTQRREVVVDNDTPGSGYDETGRWNDSGPGFAHRPPYGDGVNPFALGTHRTTLAGSADLRRARWTPDIPEAGLYAVAVSYAAAPDRTEHAVYTVRHAGGETRFAVNQRIGGGTWVHLGTFRFEAGTAGSVSLTGSGGDGQTVSADAVRFGGGVGTVERGGATSGRPRFVEAARYHLQAAGAPAHVYNVTGQPDQDYRDDYQSRGEWVNWLRAPTDGGAGFGPVGHRDAPGLGIPVDLSLAFHTDAGTTRTDTTIGTLLIFHTPGLDESGAFPDGASRLANRDLADLLQTQIVDDLRALWDPAWTRRALWDRPYSEAARPTVPSALLELLSHQNYRDMRFALDPRVRRDVSRSIYKALGRFLASHHGADFVVQPLPVTHLSATLTGPGAARLTWRPQADPLEPTAAPTAYVVYTATGDGGWDNGRRVEQPALEVRGLAPDAVHRFRVAAVNDGGESAPSEEMAVGFPDGHARPPVRIVNAFDRVAPPAALEEGNLLGFAGYLDHGVPEGVDVMTIGDQVEFDGRRPWLDDDNTGHGSSRSDLETTLIAGNTRDFAALHGAALLAAGRAFDTASDEAVWDGDAPLGGAEVVDLLLGEERTTPSPHASRPHDFAAFPPALREALAAFRANGGRLLVSGAYVGTDLAEGRPADDPGVQFLADVLGVRWRTNHAATDGRVTAVTPDLLPRGTPLTFQATRGPEAYAVEAPDGIEPAGPEGRTTMRYAETQISAAVAAPGAVTLGFPFESVHGAADRAALMAAVLRWLDVAE